MGFFGGLVSKFVSGVKKVGSAVASGVKKVGSAIKQGATNVWNKFSGKDTFKEAEELYNQISEKYNKRRRKFDEDMEALTNSIEKHVERINKSKEKIKTDLFVRMATNMERIHDISVSKDFTIEAYKEAVLSFDSIRTKDQLYKIDFNKHKFKTSVQAIFTLGFYTRKKAKETLYAVQEEEAKINTEIAKMDAETKKLEAIDKSLENVDFYFESLINTYEKLLVRLDNNVNYLYVRCLSFAHKLVHEEMSIRRLPKMQQKEVEAIITASKILKAMTDAQIVDVEDSNEVRVYGDNMKKQFTAMNEVTQAA